MKVRVKLGTESRIVDIGERAPSDVTLEELRQLVTIQFHLENHSDFQLSLNKRDALTGDDQVLSEFGIVSGDLLHIIGTNLPQINPARYGEQVRNRVQPLASHSLESAAFSSVNDSVTDGTLPQASVSAPSVSSSESAMSADGAVSRVHSDMDVSEVKKPGSTVSDGPRSGSEINRFLQEPLVVRESTGEQVPVLLQQLYSSVRCTSVNDALWVVLHTLMLESGFLPKETSDPTTMPDSWKKPGYYICTYDYNISADLVGSYSLVGVTTGASIVVHALSKSDSNFKTDHLQLRASDFVRILSNDVPETYRALDRLSRQFKDTICLPVISEIATAAGFPERVGLLGLPFEVKLRIMSFLDARSLCQLGQVCQEFSGIYQDKTVWRILFIRAFGRPDDCSLSRNWYELFRLKYEQFKEELEQRRRILYLDESDPPWGFPGSGPFRPFPPGMPFPRFIGGDYDLNPEFAAGIPNPMGGRQPPGPLPPVAPLRDPFTLGPGNLGLPGRRPPNPGSMAGSPFSSGFRGPFF